MPMDRKEERRAACACNRVKYNPITVGKVKRIFRERWSCEDCGCEFIKKKFKVGDVVGKCIEQIEYYQKSLENERDENRKLKKLALTFYQGMFKMLTEEE